MGVDTLAQTAGVLANGAQNAGQLEQQRQEAAAGGQPPPASPFDVMQHTGSGLSSKSLGEQFMDHSPAGAMVGLFHTMTQPPSASSPSAIPEAMSQGWNAVKESAAKVGTAEGGLATFGAVMGTLQSLEQMLSMAVAAIPFPAFPAVRVTDMDVGLPHAHMHPPNLIPPAPPVPLPSTGPIIPIPFLSGANKTLVNMMPAARCGDMGLGIWCGGYFPMYEVFLGSSSVWIEGNRAARLAVDITKHCIFTTPKPSDPPVGPMVGFTVTSSANVLIGGVPMPSLLNLAMGAALKALFKGLGKVASAVRKRFASRRPPSTATANSAGHPINVVSGVNFDEFLDFQGGGSLPISWRRYYTTAQAAQFGPLGYGFRHEYQRSLQRFPLGFEYTDQRGDVVGFGPVEAESRSVCNDGLLLRQLSAHVYEIFEAGQPTQRFTFAESASIAPLAALKLGPQTIEFEYDASHNLVAFESSTEARWVIEADSRGCITQVSQLVRGHPQLLVSYSYDQDGNLVRVSDALGAVTQYQYDSRHLMTRSQTPLGYGFNFEYDSVQRCIHAYGDDGLYDVSMAYFPVERSSQAVYADGAKIDYHYDANGSLTYVSNSGGVARTYITDPTGRVLEEIDGAGNKWEWIYNAWGGNVGRRDPLGRLLPPLAIEPNPPDPNQEQLPQSPVQWEWGETMTFAVTEAAKLEDESILRETPAAVYNHFLLGDPLGDQSVSQSTYDAVGRLLKEADELGASREFRRDLAGNVVQLTDRDGAITHYRYGSWNKLSQVVSPVGQTSNYEYTIREYLTKITDAGGTLSHYVYNHRDQIVEVRRHGKVRETYEYDDAGNMVAKLAGDGRPLLRWKTGKGKLDAERSLAEGDTHTFEYDDNGRVIRATWDAGEKTLERSYDADGKLILDVRDGLGIQHESQFGQSRALYLDKFEVLTQRNVDGGLHIRDPLGRTHRFQFSTAGLVKKNLANGTCELARYDGRGRVLSKVAWSQNGGGRDAWKRTYTYSSEDELRLVVDSQAGTVRYEYDAAHRLVGILDARGEVHRIARDAADNIVDMPGMQDVGLASGNRLEGVNGARFRYNDRDHLAERVTPQGATNYCYNSLDQLVKITGGQETWRATYDPLFRRTEKTWGTHRIRYYWDGHRLAAELNAAGGLRLYLYVDRDCWVPFMFIDYDSLESAPEQGRAYYVFTNQIGAPVQVQDQAGTCVWRASYEPYGRVHLAETNQLRFDLRFPGHFHDAENDLHFNRYRYYDPGLGRYLGSDPIGLAGGLNLYAYAPNPLMQVDLVGLAHDGQSGTPASTKADAPAPSKPSPPVPLKFGADDLVYGPSAGGKLRALQESAGGKLLTDLPRPMNTSWADFSRKTMNEAAQSGKTIHFDLTHMDDLPGTLAGTGEHANKVTGQELRHLRDNPEIFNSNNTKFYKDGVEVPPPW